MAKLFQVNLPDGLSSVKLDSQGRATIQYTVRNVSARSLDGRAVLISLPQDKSASGAVEKGWVKIDGKTDRHFDPDKEETFTVKIAVPPKSPAGTYTFRLDTVWVDQPDQGDPGGAIAFTVAEAVTTSHFPLWIIPVIAVVLIAIGVGIWLAVRKKPGDTTQTTAQTPEKSTTQSTPNPGNSGTHTVVEPKPVRYEETKETNRSPDEPSGSCASFSQLYTLCSVPKPSDWKIVASSFQLYGDRNVCEKWSHCDRSVGSPTQACYRFQLQGHSEDCNPFNPRGGIKFSHGELTVTWQHPVAP